MAFTDFGTKKVAVVGGLVIIVLLVLAVGRSAEAPAGLPSGSPEGGSGVVQNVPESSTSSGVTSSSNGGVVSSGSGVKSSVPKTAQSGKLAPEIRPASFYINSMNDPVTLAAYRGKKVVVLFFWSYTSVNSKRTVPYINNWYAKYKEKGLEVVAVHVPEFAFQKDHTAVKDAALSWKMAYPVVVDNDAATWAAYGNKNWPHYYLIDIDGRIAYDHVGEGEFAAAEAVVQRLLSDRSLRLKGPALPSSQISVPQDAVSVDLSKIRTPQIYGGTFRNSLLANAQQLAPGMQTLILPTPTPTDRLGLGGTWNFTSEYTENKTENSTMNLGYSAKAVYAVFGAVKPIRVVVTRDGAPLGAAGGRDVVVEKGESVLYVTGPGRLYEIVSDPSGYGAHDLQFTVSTPGLNFYTITFG